MMVASAQQNPKSTCSSQDHQQTSIRTPLLPFHKDNTNINSNPKRTKSKNVSSRYMSPSTSNASSVSTSRRFPSPLLSRNSPPVLNGASLGPKRSVSADRRRPVASRALTTDLVAKQSNAAEPSSATKMLVTSTRSLSVSFQGEYFSLPVSKTKVVPSSPSVSSVRKGTPERRRSVTPSRVKVDVSGDQVENPKPGDQHRWPARARQGNSLSRSLDCSGSERSTVIESGNMIRTLQQSLMDERRSSFDGRLSLDLVSPEPLKATEQATNGNLVNNELLIASDLTPSDTDSVSSGSSSGVQGSGGSARMHSGPSGIASSARFWQETNSRLRRLQDPGSPLSTSPSSKFIAPSKLRKYASDTVLSSPRTMSSSPIRGGARLASPCKLVTPRTSSPLRGFSSPSRVRNAVSTINNNFTDTPSVLSFSVDVRRGKVGENRIFDAHLLRLMYNRHLQWRFVNARAEESLLVQRHIVEKNLRGAWIMISNLRDTVTKKRHRLQLLRRKLKLASILKGQIRCLEEWASLDKGHCISLLGAIEALKASTLRLPVVGGATADIQSLKDAVGSAVDVMQTMLSSIHSYLPKVFLISSFFVKF
ncbi:hypothetical protein LIER_41217 [Lithospermum erythrorhizon]|uniref:QWRF motif-containing protein 2 n=1 Tax=Lithospermum erythrorhizon TaxID=34254 RepID=A0AAV3R9I9_LITER